jgi:antitoxin HicB
MIDDVENGTVGSSFDDFLKEQGTYEATIDQAVKRVLAFQLKKEMKAQGINKIVMAQKLQTSRSQLDRVLDPKNERVSLSLLIRAAQALGRKLHLELQ